MSDYLVKRARHNAKADMPHHASVSLIVEMADRIEELEAKLAKAVDVDLIEQAVSDVLSEGGSYRDAAEYVARTTLAELKGDSDE